MAHLTRTPMAKSGKNWTPAELLAFKISILEKDTQEFFGFHLPAQVQRISPVILDNVVMPADTSTISLDDEDFFKNIKSAMPPPGEQAFVVDFVVHLLRNLMRYAANGSELRVHTRIPIPFEMCGERVTAIPNVCVMDDVPNFFLVVEEDKRQGSSVPAPDCALIADAIAAFSANNLGRVRLGKKPLERAIIPGITFTGSAPIFYKIPVSRELVKAVIIGQYPTAETVVERFVPPVQDRRRYEEDGMRPLENRRIVFRALEAFRELVVASVWT